MSKNPKKMMKIVHWRVKLSYLLNDLRNVVEICRKNVNYDTIKSYKKGGFHPLSRKRNSRKTTVRGQIDASIP